MGNAPACGKRFLTVAFARRSALFGGAFAMAGSAAYALFV